MAAEHDAVWHPLRVILHAYLATDAKAVESLKHTLAVLSKEALAPSSHLQKWSARLSALMHASEPSARWAGLCLALKTAQLSKSVMIECAQAWVTVALPLLSVNEPAPVVKAAARLLEHIFSQAVDLQEFQRQIATPNVPKYAMALLQLLRTGSAETSTLLAQLLARIIPLYPTLIRANHAHLSEFCTSVLWGTSRTMNSAPFIKAVSSLYAVLHFTGGKAGASSLWRKSFDELLTFASGSLHAMRTHTVNGMMDQSGILPVSACLEQLQNAVSAMSSLLRANPARPVPVPMAKLCSLVVAMFSCTSIPPRDPSAEPIRQAEELAVVPAILELASELMVSSAPILSASLVPYRNQLLFYICYHLEQPAAPTTTLALLTAAHAVLDSGAPTHDAQVLARLAKAALPRVAGVAHAAPGPDEPAPGAQSRKGKKRVRAYEGEEVLRASDAPLCASALDARVLVRSVDVLDAVLRAANTPGALRSLGARALLGALLALPHTPPAALCAADPGAHGALARAVRRACGALCAGSSGVLSRSTGLVLAFAEMDVDFELLLHPRVPALARPLPHVEHLSLFAAEEGADEAEVRAELGLVPAAGDAVRVPEPAPAPTPRVEAAPFAFRTPVQPPAPAAAPAPAASRAMPPPPDPLPSSSTALQRKTVPPPDEDRMETDHPAAAPVPAPAPKPAAPPRPLAAVQTKADENEEMPGLDLDSDSDSD